MIKATVKNVAISLIILSMVIVVLVAVDISAELTVAKPTTKLRVSVVDINGSYVYNAKVTVCGQTFYTDNKGLSPVMELTDIGNSYDGTVTSWHTANVVVTKDGYVPTVVLNAVITDSEMRQLTVRVYPTDSSQLPCVCYVETPPQQYLDSLIK